MTHPSGIAAGGEVLRLGHGTPKGVTGYDVTSLVVGSEGTLAIVTGAMLRLVPPPESVVTALVFLPDLDAVGRAIGAVLEKRIVPRCVELLDSIALEIVRPQAGLPIPEGAGAMLLVELDGPEAVIETQLEVAGNTMMEAGAMEVLVAQDGTERERLWGARRELSYSLRRQAKNKLAEDVVVPRTRISALLDHCRRLSEELEITMPTYGHAGDGNLHVNFLWNEPDERPRVDRAIRSLFEHVIELGGTLSGEHGIGLLKKPYLPLEHPPPLIALQKNLKSLFDPHHILNPTKIFPTHGPC